MLEYQEADGSRSHEFATRLLSFPKRGIEQCRRERLFIRNGYREIADASRALSGKAYLEACRHGFVDLPGFSFSQSHRAWANKQLAGVMYLGLPKEAFTSVTILIAAVPTFRMAPFSDERQINELVDAAWTRLARTLRSAGAKVVYLSGGVEIAQQESFHQEERVRNYIAAYRERHWPKDWATKHVEYVQVIHLHVGLWAHDGRWWLSKEQLWPAFRSEYLLPSESWLARRPQPKAPKNAKRVAGYLKKNPSHYSDMLIIEDAVVRLKVQPDRLWEEGFWCFDDPKTVFRSCKLRDRERTRRLEIEKLALTGAAVGFRDQPRVWSGDLLTVPELRARRSWCRTLIGDSAARDWRSRTFREVCIEGGDATISMFRTLVAAGRALRAKMKRRS